MSSLGIIVVPEKLGGPFSDGSPPLNSGLHFQVFRFKESMKSERGVEHKSHKPMKLGMSSTTVVIQVRFRGESSRLEQL